MLHYFDTNISVSNFQFFQKKNGAKVNHFLTTPNQMFPAHGPHPGPNAPPSCTAPPRPSPLIIAIAVCRLFIAPCTALPIIALPSLPTRRHLARRLACRRHARHHLPRLLPCHRHPAPPHLSPPHTGVDSQSPPCRRWPLLSLSCRSPPQPVTTLSASPPTLQPNTAPCASQCRPSQLPDAEASRHSRAAQRRSRTVQCSRSAPPGVCHMPGMSGAHVPRGAHVGNHHWCSTCHPPIFFKFSIKLCYQAVTVSKLICHLSPKFGDKILPTELCHEFW